MDRVGSVEKDGFVSLHEDTVLKVVAEAPCKDGVLDILAEAHHIFDCIVVSDTDDVLLDDGADVQIFGDVVAGGTDQLDPALVGLIVGPCADEGRKLWWMLITRCRNCSQSRGGKICI